MTHPTRFPRRTLQAGAWAVALALSAAAGHAETGHRKKVDTCTARLRQATGRDHAGKLREERDVLRTCAQASCSRETKERCAARAAQVESEIPTVIPRVSGDRTSEVEVRMDGEILASHLDGRPLPVDPGVHDFTFTTRDGTAAPQRVTLARGEHARPIAFVLPATKAAHRAAHTRPMQVAEEPHPSDEEPGNRDPDAPSPEAATNSSAARSGPPTAAYVLGGLGAVAVGSGLLLTMWGRRDNKDLLSGCAPGCPEASVTHVRRLYVAADVAWGVSIAALGVAGILWATSSETKKSPETTAYRFDVQPTRSGAFATVSGAF